MSEKQAKATRVMERAEAFIVMLMTRCGCTNALKMTGTVPTEITLPLAPPFEANRIIVANADIPHAQETRIFRRTAGMDEAHGVPVYRFLESK